MRNYSKIFMIVGIGIVVISVIAHIILKMVGWEASFTLTMIPIGLVIGIIGAVMKSAGDGQ